MSISPRRSRVCFTRPSMSSTLEASATAISIAAFSAASSCCSARRRSLRRAAAITRAPSRAKRIAVSRPMPLEAPITSTTWFVSFSAMPEIVTAPTPGTPFPRARGLLDGADYRGVAGGRQRELRLASHNGDGPGCTRLLFQNAVVVPRTAQAAIALIQLESGMLAQVQEEPHPASLAVCINPALQIPPNQVLHFVEIPSRE